MIQTKRKKEIEISQKIEQIEEIINFVKDVNKSNYITGEWVKSGYNSYYVQCPFYLTKRLQKAIEVECTKFVEELEKEINNII